MKNKNLLVVIFFIIATVYNILLFSVVNEYTTVFWMVYVFTMLAIIIVAITYLLAFRYNNSYTFLNIPVTIIATIYFFVQLLCGIILLTKSNISVVFANVTQIVILGMFLIIGINGIIGKNMIVDSENEYNKKKFYIKSLATKIEGLIEGVFERTHKSALINLYDTIRYSDPISHQSLEDLEQKIAEEVSVLADEINNGNTFTLIEKCSVIEKLMSDRNRKCKLLK